MTRFVRYIVPVALIALAGCASAPPMAYYTIAMDHTGAPAPAVNLSIDRIQVAEALSRKDLLIKKSPTEIEYYAAAQWAAGVNDLVQEKLAEEFGPPREGMPTISLTLFVQSFEQADLPEGAEARAKITVEFRKERYGDDLLKKTYTEREPAESNPNAIAQALSRCLERIAQNIAADAGKLQ